MIFPREICTHRDPAKKKTLLQYPGKNPVGKQNLDSIRGENLKGLGHAILSNFV